MQVVGPGALHLLH